jgi:hypothetical protein
MRSFAFALAAFAFASSLTGCSGVDSGLVNPGSKMSTGEPPSGSKVFVKIAASQAPVASSDGSSRETPSDQRVGVLGLELLRSETDTSPLVVFQNAAPVDTGYNDGNVTLVGTADASSLAAGTYLFARVPVAYVKFSVAGTYHDGSLPIPGQFSDAVSLSADTLLDGATRDRGWWTADFLVDGVSEGASSGEGAAIGQPGATSGIRLDMTGPVAAYVFPVHLVVDPSVDHDVTLLFTANIYQDFHWQDENVAGDAPGVFDVSYGAFEPVTQLGANSITATMEE